jgi:hypothetical protein
MKISVASHSYKSLTKNAVVVNAATLDSAYKEFVYDTGFGFSKVEKITWSVGSIGYVEVHWSGYTDGIPAFTLSGNGSLEIEADKPVMSDGQIMLKFYNFSTNDAAMVAVFGVL